MHVFSHVALTCATCAPLPENSTKGSLSTPHDDVGKNASPVVFLVASNWSIFVAYLRVMDTCTYRVQTHGYLCCKSVGSLVCLFDGCCVDCFILGCIACGSARVGVRMQAAMGLPLLACFAGDGNPSDAHATLCVSVCECVCVCVFVAVLECDKV